MYSDWYVNILLLNYFNVIEAYEILGNPKRRVAYDSVDPTFNDTVPSVCAHSKENFYEVFESVFEENSR